MPNYLNFHEAIVGLIRGSGISTGVPGADFDWNNQPYYREAPEMMPTSPIDGKLIPFVWYDLLASTKQDNIGMTGSAYTETYELQVKVSASPDDVNRLSTPYGDPKRSLLAFLDSIQDPANFASNYFDVTEFERTSYEIELDQQRGPDTARVYVGKGTFKVVLTVNYPPANRVGPGS